MTAPITPEQPRDEDGKFTDEPAPIEGAKGDGEAPWPPHEVDDLDEVAEATRAIIGGKGLPVAGVRKLGDGTGRVAVYTRKTKTGALVGVLNADQYVAALEAAAKVGVLDGSALNASGEVHPEVRSAADEARDQLQKRRERALARLAAVEAELDALE